MSFRIVPISKEYVARKRAAGLDDLGNELSEQVAAGYGPCRVSLKPFVPGVDRRILISHSPSEVANAFKQPRPVFLEAAEIDEYRGVYRLPPESEAGRINFPLTLIGYSVDQRMVFAELVGDRDGDEMIERVLRDRADIGYLHARNAGAGC